MKIDLLKEKYKKALANPDFQFGVIQEIVSEINSLAISEKETAIGLYKQIGEELFKRGVSVSNYDLNKLLHDISEWKKRKIKIEVTVKEFDGIAEFNEKLVKFINCVKEDISNLKRYVILKLGNEKTNITRIILLHDDHSNNPYLRSICNKLNSEATIDSIANFNRKLSEDHAYNKSCFIALVTFSPGVDSEKDCYKFIDDLESIFGIDIMQLNISNFEQSVISYTHIKDLDIIKEEIGYLVRTDMTNDDLKPAEEKIIKKIFRKHNCHDITYKELRSGMSGSKVIEVQPVKDAVRGIRSVIKINDNKEKLIKEETNFNTHVADLDKDYGSIQSEETEKYKAIKYSYASTNAFIDSEPFSSKLANLPYSSTGKLKEIIKKLFAIQLFDKWKQSRFLAEIIIAEYYNQFLRVEEIIKSIALIKNMSVEDVKKDQLISNFNKIYHAKIKSYIKKCHGDLHTGNFFIDISDKIFLIDFGDTGLHHALVDHATLECSIKFRHIPRYIDIEYLKNIEKELLKKETFDSGYRFEKNSRKDITIHLELLNEIRVLSQKYFYNNYIEYLISLFLITFRQIRYPALNQLYAVESAYILSNEIVEKL